MFVLVVAVPGLLVVVLGYVVGYGLRSWIGGWADAAFGTSLATAADAAGWLAGLLGLAGALRWVVRRWRRGPLRE